MTGILMTQVSTPIIGQAAWLLGKIMDGIYRVMDLIGIHNLGVCIILLTIVIYTLLMPLTIKQQKFSKMSAAMNPELQKVQQKYKGKNDQASMQKMQEETQLVYEKYGVSPTGGCLSMFIQFPILWAMYYVIRNIPAYVGQVKAVYTPLLTSIMAQDGWQKVMEKIGEAKPILMSASKYDYSDKNVLIDVLYKFQTSTWETLGKKLPDLQSTIDSTVDTLKSMNNFLGLNIAETPMNLISNGVKAGAWGIVIMAVLIPVLSGLSQYLSVKLSQQTTAVTNNPQADQRSTISSCSSANRSKSRYCFLFSLTSIIFINRTFKFRFLFLFPEHGVLFFTSNFIQTFTLNNETFSLVKRNCSGILLVYI